MSIGAVDTIKPLGNFPVVEAADIGESPDAKVFTAAEREKLQVAGLSSLYETTDLAEALLIFFDSDGRVAKAIPDYKPLIDAQAATIPGTQYFECTDRVSLRVLDAAGRVAFDIADPTGTLAAHTSALSATATAVSSLLSSVGTLSQGVAAASVSTLFESTEATASDVQIYILDAGGHVVASLPDSRIGPIAASAATTAIYETTDVAITQIVLDAGGRVVALVPSQSAVAAATPSTVAEVVTARGNAASLSARLAPTITSDGAPIVDRYGKSFLRHMHYRLAKRRLPTPEAVQLIINVAGDSYTHNPARWSGPFMDYMAAKYGDAGGGWCGFGGLPMGNVAPWTLANQPTYMQANVRPATYPTRLFGNVAQTYYTAASPDLAMATLSAAGDICCQAFPAAPVHNGCDLFFLGTADGVVQFSWGTYNAGSVADPASYTFAAATQINVQGALNTTQIADIKAGMSGGQGMLKIEWVAGTAKLSGVNLKSAASGVRVNKLAATGSNIAQWAGAPATQWEAGLAGLGAHAVIYMDGTNSQTGGMASSAWGTHLSTLVGRFRAASPGLDVLLATPAENQRTTNAVPMTAYATEGRKRALALRTAFTDMQAAFGDPSNPAEYGSAGVIPLYNADLIHPEPSTGGRSIVAEFLDMAEPF